LDLGLDGEAELLADVAGEKAAYRMLLPARRLHHRAERRALFSTEQREDSLGFGAGPRRASFPIGGLRRRAQRRRLGLAARCSLPGVALRRAGRRATALLCSGLHGRVLLFGFGVMTACAVTAEARGGRRGAGGRVAEPSA